MNAPQKRHNKREKGGILAKVPHENRHFKVPIVYFFKNKERLFVVKGLIFDSTQKSGKSNKTFCFQNCAFSVFLVWEKTALKFRVRNALSKNKRGEHVFILETLKRDLSGPIFKTSGLDLHVQEPYSILYRINSLSSVYSACFLQSYVTYH